MNDKNIIDKLYIFILDYYKKNNQTFPSFGMMQKELNIDNHHLITLLRELENRKLIVRKVSHYFIPDNNNNNNDNDNNFIKNKKHHNKSIIVYRIFCGIIGLITFYISFLYSYNWFKYLLSPFNAVFFSVAIVGFLVISFELTLFFVINKKYIISIFFIFLWVTTTLFSMSSTIAGQQKKMVDNRILDYDQDHNQLLILQEIEKEISDIQIDIESKRQERVKLLQFLDKIDNYNQNKADYRDINYRIYLKNESLKKMRVKLENLQSKKMKILNNGLNLNVDKKIDFFEWLESIFQIKYYIFQFWLYLSPSIFIDLICPISFSIVFFLRDI